MSQLNSIFQLEWHGDAVVVIPAKDVETMRWDLIEEGTSVLLSPLKGTKVPLVIFDLSGLEYVGSVFLSLVLLSHKLVKGWGGEIVICGASPMARELLRVTALDTLWAIYDKRQQVLETLT
ncbi:MAG: STAS domain-containing protein [Planctomycetales bacterium]